MLPLAQKKFFFSPDLSILPKARKILRDFFAGVLNPATLAEVVQSADEALSNIIEHGFKGEPDGKIELELLLYPKEVVVILKDNAPNYNPLKEPIREPSEIFSEGKEGGYGIHIFKTLMKVEYEELKPKGNCLILRKDYEKNQSR